MSKTFITLVISLLFTSYAFSQTNSDSIGFEKKNCLPSFKELFWTNDTIIKKGKKFKVSNIAIEIGAGGGKIFYDQTTLKHFSNYWGSASKIYFYYKNFFFGDAGIGISMTRLSDSLVIQNQTIIRSADLEIDNQTFSFGYNIDIGDHFSVDPYVAVAQSFFFYFHQFANTSGFGAGLSINKYFTMRPKRELGVYVNGSYNHANYNEWNSSLGKYFYTIQFGLEYKFWILKKIKSE
jgi:hypothetical protein